MIMDREKEREIELESAMYTNCLLLGLDPSIIGISINTATPRVGLFRHSNPKLGEQLLYFILYSLRGPIQSAKDFDKVWPIFDAAQARDFRKAVQGVISELESQGALPRNNSSVSSLATCCGTRFVELLWQLSLLALREVHKRAFPADVASNPLPSPLTDTSLSHAACLLPITKAKIAIERRKFLKNAEEAVQRQAMWSDLAHEMTAAFRGLCAEEAHLQQELDKLHETKNKAKFEDDGWDHGISSSNPSISKATQLWDSLLSHESKYEILSSGPVEDLIAHREHRYRISGSALLAAMDQSSEPNTTSAVHSDNKEHVDDRIGKTRPTVDVAEIIRRWTHALQRIHKQSLQLAKVNDGAGPQLLRVSHDGVGHVESLTATLMEHKQHLSAIQVLINQLKDVAPSLQKSISQLTEEVSSISSNRFLIPDHNDISTFPTHDQNREKGCDVDEVARVTSKLSHVQIEDIPTTSSSPMKAGSTHDNIVSETNYNPHPLMTTSLLHHQVQDGEAAVIRNLKKSVREAALSASVSSPKVVNPPKTGSMHFFVPVSSTGLAALSPKKPSPSKHKSLLETRPRTTLTDNRDSSLRDSGGFDDLFRDSGMSRFLSPTPSTDPGMPFFEVEENGVMSSPPLLLDASLLLDSYEDLLAPLSESETALMDY